MAITQENRKIQVITPLGTDVLLFYQMQSKEALSSQFEYSIKLLSKSMTISPEKLLGENISLRIESGDGTWRYFNGFVTSFGQYGNLKELAIYHVIVRPWLWFLTRTSNCRIFQNKSAPDIIQQVFRDHGFSDFKVKLSGSYASREYCVQYRETDFNFVSRLMEEEGIYYYFTHGKDKHDLVMIDSGNSHEKFPGYAKIPYHADDSATDRSRVDHIYEWGFKREVQPGAYELTDYDFKKPKAKLLVKSKLKESHSHAEHEFFDYPGGYTETSVGENLVRRRMEEHHVRFERCEGKANARGLAVGYLFDLDEFPREDQNKEYLIVSADFYMLSDDYSSETGNSGEQELFTCTFTAQDNKRPYHPPRTTLKPLVHGAQTATVVGPSGEEIYVDKYGRVKVLFHWDRKERWEEGKKEEDSSCWIRVSHPWAGKGWGAVSIPRIDQEVIVDFLEGDPDQPIITGRVYNANQMPPYELPANATQSGMKSRSSKGGSADNFNEIRFEDKMGSEEMYIHAEKDQNILVENDRAEEIDRDRSLLVKRDKSETVERNKVVHVAGNHSENIDGAMSLVIGKTLTETVLINYAETVGGAMELTVGAVLAITVGAAMSEAVGAAKSEAIGGSKTESIGHNKTMTIGANLTESVKGNQSVTIDKDFNETISGTRRIEVKKESMLQAKKIQITAEDQINLKTGDAEIIMKKNGDITIKGGKITIKASSDLILKGSKITEN